MKRIAWCIGLLAVLATRLSHGQVLETRAYLTVTGPDIMLADLVVNPTEIPAEWKTRSVGAAPAPGASLTYALRTLAASLEPYKDMSAVSLKGTLHVTVLRDGVIVPPPPLTEAIEAYAHEHAPWTGKQITVTYDPLKTSFQMPTGAVVKVLSCDLARGNDCSRFELAADTPDRRMAQVTVVARIALLSKVWVIKHDMSRGEVLGAKDLEVSQPPQGRSGRYLDTTENIVGLELNRAVRTGQCLESHFLIQPLCARQGETVAVATGDDNLRIVMRAKALASGRKNERILCLNEASGRKLFVRLTGTREATPEY
jgi:flagella basal body P-ring formation protein FlgA